MVVEYFSEVFRFQFLPLKMPKASSLQKLFPRGNSLKTFSPAFASSELREHFSDHVPAGDMKVLRCAICDQDGMVDPLRNGQCAD